MPKGRNRPQGHPARIKRESDWVRRNRAIAREMAEATETLNAIGAIKFRAVDADHLEFELPVELRERLQACGSEEEADQVATAFLLERLEASTP